jgi:hypothetical protein
MSRIFKIVVTLLLGFAGTTTAQVTEGKAAEETKITEVITTDSVPSSELVKRAINWVKIESPKYTKASGVTTGTKAECNVSFPVRPKELNPVCDYTGKITMKVIVECKDSKYKYTVEHIKHVSAGGKTSIGSIDNIIPECGSMVMPDLTLKKLKGEAMKYAGFVVNDIKESMKVPSNAVTKEEW